MRHNDGRDYILSNNHVLANSDYANVGDSIYQPGPHDGGDRNSVIGRLSSWRTFAQGTNYVDAALAEPLEGSVDPSILEIGSLAGTATATLESNVRKSGRTTGLTEGIVRFLGAYLQVSYSSLGVRYFDDQVVIESLDRMSPFSAGGDSGSVVVNDSNRVIGLLFAGSPTFTLANPIQTVFEQLEIKAVRCP